MHAYVAPPLSRRQIRDLALDIRKMLGVEDELWFPAVEFIEQVIPMLDPTVVFEVGEMGRLGDDHGVTYRDGDKVHIVIREDVYCGACAGKGRDRGTCAHEGGHYMLHTRAVLHPRGRSARKWSGFAIQNGKRSASKGSCWSRTTR